MNPWAKLIALPFVILLIWLLAVLARRRARPQRVALERAQAEGEPFSSEVKAYLAVLRPRWWTVRYVYGVLYIRPGSLSWESRFRRRQVDLSGATLISEIPDDGKMDFVARYEMRLRRGDQTFALLARRPQVPLVRAGLQQFSQASPHDSLGEAVQGGEGEARTDGV